MKIHVASFWKCGTTLQDKIFARYADLLGFTFFKRQNPPIGGPENYVCTCDNLLLPRAFNSDKVICIIRHPLNRLISQYYSYGWTHSDKCDWIIDPKERLDTIERIVSHREEIRGLTLDQYVQKFIKEEKNIKNLSKPAELFDKHLKHASFHIYRRAFNYEHKNMIIISYEKMMNDPKWFLDLSCPEHSDILLKEFSSEFNWSNGDLSDKIVRGESDSHRRIIDHEEYKKKLSTETISLAEEKVGKLLKEYDNLFQKGFIKAKTPKISKPKTNIVFYIRALFYQSLMPGTEKTKNPDVKRVADYFNSFAGISVQDYRKRLHDIQLENLYKISDRVIYNQPDLNPKRKFNYTYCVLQQNTIDLLYSLNDNDILVPLDDDDWLSPELNEIEFLENHMNYWHTVSFNHTNKKVDIFYHYKNRNLPNKLTTEEEFNEARGLLSNCQSMPAWLIKKLILNEKFEILQQLLQRHSMVRKLIREEPISEWDLKENILDKVLSVYVRHAANITLFNKTLKYGEETLDKEKYEDLVRPFKVARYLESNIPENLKWTSPYLTKLEELNKFL